MPRKHPPNPLDDERPLEVIGGRLRAWRDDRGLTQVELAERAGLSQVGLSLYELGNRAMKITAALHLARSLDLTIDAMLMTDPT